MYSKHLSGLCSGIHDILFCHWNNNLCKKWSYQNGFCRSASYTGNE